MDAPKPVIGNYTLEKYVNNPASGPTRFERIEMGIFVKSGDGVKTFPKPYSTPGRNLGVLIDILSHGKYDNHVGTTQQFNFKGGYRETYNQLSENDQFEMMGWTNTPR